MQNFNLEMLNLNFPGTRWRGLAFVGAPIKTCQGMRFFTPFFNSRAKTIEGILGQKLNQLVAISEFIVVFIICQFHKISLTRTYFLVRVNDLII